MKFLAGVVLLLSVLAFVYADDASAETKSETDVSVNTKTESKAEANSDSSEPEEMAVRGGYVPEGYSAPVMKKVIPVKKVVEYVKPQPMISYAHPIPIKSVEPLLVETKHIGGYGPYGSYGARRDILPAPIIPLVPWQEILEIIAVALEIAFREVEPVPAAVANNVNWFARLFKETRNIPGVGY